MDNGVDGQMDEDLWMRRIWDLMMEARVVCAWYYRRVAPDLGLASCFPFVSLSHRLGPGSRSLVLGCCRFLIGRYPAGSKL